MTAALLEKSHGKLRIIGQRPSHQKPVDTEARRTRDHNPDGTFKKGNRAGLNSRGRRGIAEHLRAAHKRLLAIRSRSETPAAEDRILGAAWGRYEAARRELGSDSLLVLSPLARWAEDEERVRDLGERADRAGIETVEGQRLLDRRDALEGKANRAMAAALAAASALPVRGKATDLDAAVREAAKPRGAE